MQAVPPISHSTCTSYKPYLLLGVPHARITSYKSSFMQATIPPTNHTSCKLFLLQAVPHTNHTSHKLYLMQAVPPRRRWNLRTAQRGFIFAKSRYYTHRINSIYFVTFIRNDKISLILTSDGFPLVTLGPLPGLNVNGI